MEGKFEKTCSFFKKVFFTAIFLVKKRVNLKALKIATLFILIIRLSENSLLSEDMAKNNKVFGNDI